MATATKPTLADLSAEERAALRQEMAEQEQAVRVAEMDAHARAVRSLIRDRDHLEGCPGIVGQGRVEAFGSVKPANPSQGTPAEEWTVGRCIECGGSRTIKRPYAEVITTAREGMEV